MTSPLLALRGLSSAEMRALASALSSGALRPPFSARAVSQSVRADVADAVAAALSTVDAASAAAWLALLAEERGAVHAAHDEVQLVWTGPEGGTSTALDTWVVVTDLFRSARRELVVASYALHDGRSLLDELAQAMAAAPELAVRMYLHVPRAFDDDTTSEAELLRRFADRFVARDWPTGVRRPEVFYDPRTIAVSRDARASLHAKVIVADRARVLVTSANLTKAAQLRNIEAGVVVENAALAGAVLEQFEALVVRGALVRVPGIA